jgi:hypothetical protein
VRDDAVYYFAYTEDYGQTVIDFNQGQLGRHTHRPAFEVVFVHAAKRRTLDTAHKGSRATVRALNRGFGRAVLGVDLPDEPADDRVYDLDRFKRRNFPFAWDAASGIRAVTVVLLRFSHGLDPSGRATFEAKAKDGPGAVYDQVDLWTRGMGTSMAVLAAHVTKVNICVQFAPSGRRGRNTRTFTLTYPNGCNLRHDGRDGVIRQMLIDSGIELVWPTDAAA